MLEILKEIILDFQNEYLFTGTKRHLQYELVKGKAFVCVGVRRCGKSTDFSSKFIRHWCGGHFQ